VSIWTSEWVKSEKPKASAMVEIGPNLIANTSNEDSDMAAFLSSLDEDSPFSGTQSQTQTQTQAESQIGTQALNSSIGPQSETSMGSDPKPGSAPIKIKPMAVGGDVKGTAIFWKRITDEHTPFCPYLEKKKFGSELVGSKKVCGCVFACLTQH
jgi:hypothetical protein